MPDTEKMKTFQVRLLRMATLLGTEQGTPAYILFKGFVLMIENQLNLSFVTIVTTDIVSGA
jgi:hypothetical protein